MGLKNTGRQCTIDSFAAHDLRIKEPIKAMFSRATRKYIAEKGKCSMSEIKQARAERNA